MVDPPLSSVLFGIPLYDKKIRVFLSRAGDTEE
jgi:hypothetical protein